MLALAWIDVCSNNPLRIGVQHARWALTHWRSIPLYIPLTRSFSCPQSLGPFQGARVPAQVDNRGRLQRGQRIDHDTYRPRYEDRCSHSPAPRFRAASRSQGFQSGAGSSSHPACAVCLGRHTHDISDCKAPSTWDGKHSTFSQRRGGVLTTYSGKGICKDFQTRRGCTHRSHPKRHICSGCGDREHGAQDCPRAQRRD